MSNKHKWADVIHAYAEGKKIQYRSINGNGEWKDTECLDGLELVCLDWRVKPHKYQDVIDAYVRGETVQYYAKNQWNSGWIDIFKGCNLSVFDVCQEFRIKPEPKKDIRARLWSHHPNNKFFLTFVFDGETKEFKTVEFHDE